MNAVPPGLVLPNDDKDWTWVLERRCPECGFEAAAVPRESIAGLVRDVVAGWEGELHGRGVTNRGRPDRWSALEYGCHVRDVFRVCDARLQLMLVLSDPLFPNWDQDRTAVEDDYSTQDPAAVGASLRLAGARFADDVESLSARQWARNGRRSDGAVFDVAGFARYVLHDPVHHLADIGADQVLTTGGSADHGKAIHRSVAAQE